MTELTDEQVLELYRRYGRVRSYGTIERGDGSERCVVCSLREIDHSWYVWSPGPTPVCSHRHAAQWLEVLEQRH